MSSMKIRRIATSVAAVLLAAGLTTVATAPTASADTGWGFRSSR
jgi:hypothetical protein